MADDHANVFSENIITKDNGTDAASPQFGFEYSATTKQTVGPRWIRVTSDPNGVLTAPKGSIASDSTGGVVYINTNGLTAWTQVTTVAFAAAVSANKTVAQTITAGAAAADITGYTTLSDATGSFDATTGVFTAAKAGTYRVSAYFSPTAAAGAIVAELQLVTNLATVAHVAKNIANGGVGTIAIEAIVVLAAGGTVKCQMVATTTDFVIDVTAGRSQISINRVS